MKRYLLFLLTISSFYAAAQSNFKKGYVIKASKDTVYGFIDYKERDITPKSFRFKPTLNSAVEVMTAQDILSCVIEGLERHDAFTVHITTSTTDIANLSVEPDLSFRTDTVFLQVLQHGKNMTLYSFTDQVKQRFYVKEKDMPVPSELIRQMYLREDGVMVTGESYRRQVRALMLKFYPERGNNRLFDKLKYEKTDLLKAAALINDQEVIKSKFTAYRFFAGAGITATSAEYLGNNSLANDNSISKTSYFPAVTAGLDLFSNPAIRKLILRVELSFMASKNEVSLAKDDLSVAGLSQTFDEYALTLTPQLIYNVYNRDKFKVFIGAGAGINKGKYSNVVFKRYNPVTRETYTAKDDLDLQSFYITVPFTAGVTLNKKIELSFRYYLPASITNYIAYNVFMQRSRIGINYLFGK